MLMGQNSIYLIQRDVYMLLFWTLCYFICIFKKLSLLKPVTA